MARISKVLAVVVGLTVAGGCQRGQEQMTGSEATGERSLADAGPGLVGKAFEVSISAPARVQAGEGGELRVHIAARPGFKLNEEYPHSFRPEADVPGVRFEENRIPLAEAPEDRTPCKGAPGDDCAAVTAVPFSVTEEGPRRVSGVVSFSVCNPKVCLIEKVPVATTVEATASP
jgi:hypothetical protein